MVALSFCWSHIDCTYPCRWTANNFDMVKDNDSKSIRHSQIRVLYTFTDQSKVNGIKIAPCENITCYIFSKSLVLANITEQSFLAGPTGVVGVWGWTLSCMGGHRWGEYGIANVSRSCYVVNTAAWVKGREDRSILG